MSDILIRKDGSQSIANENGPGINPESVATIVAEHDKLRADGFHTGEVSSGATLEGIAHAIAMGLNPDELSRKIMAMNGLSSHFETWREKAEANDLFVVSSLSTDVELEEADEGRQIRGGMGEALAHPRILLVANYHDEADPREMNEFEKTLAAKGYLLRTESEENDFHSANIALATGAAVLMLCTMADGFMYKGQMLRSIHVDDIPKYLRYIEETESDNGKGLSKGGMKTKLQAARAFITNEAAVRQARVVIGNSKEDSRRLIEGDSGTEVVK